MPPQEVARQWFIAGEGIDRTVISADIQRYLGNDATVRPGVGTGEYQGVNGYWIKAYRNLTSAMIADLRADSGRWRQEQRQTGIGENYVGSRTYDESNAARVQRRDGNSPSLDGYGAGGPPDGRRGEPRRQPVDPMQVDPPQGRAAQNQGGYPQQGYYQQDPRGQYQQDPRYAPQGRGQGYTQDQPMADVYGQPDAYGRYAVNPTYPQQDRGAPGYAQPAQGPPPGYARQGEFYVPITSGYGQPGMIATSAPNTGYYAEQQQPPQGRGPVQPNQRDPRAAQPAYGQQEYNPYPSPAQTVTAMNTNPRDRDSFANQQHQAGYGAAQPQYDQYNRPVSNPQSQYPYAPDPGYATQPRESTQRTQQPPAQGDERRRRNR